MQKQTITESFKEINGKFKEVVDLKNTSEKKAEELDPEDQTKEFLAEFFDHAQQTMTYIDQKIRAIDEKYAGLIKLFGEDVKTYPLDKFVLTFKKLYNELLVRILFLFFRDVSKNIKKIKKRRKKKPKRKLKRKLKVNTIIIYN